MILNEREFVNHYGKVWDSDELKPEPFLYGKYYNRDRERRYRKR